MSAPTNPISTATPDLPAVPGSMPFVHNLETAPAYWWLDILWVVLVDGADTGGRYSLMHETLLKGSGAPPHKHTWSDEHFYMLDGEVSFLIGDEIRTARTGDFVFVPRNTRHAFRVDSNTAIFLNSYTPAGLELAVIENAMPAPQLLIPPKGATPMPNLTPEQYRRYGMDNAPGGNPFVTEAKEENCHGRSSYRGACRRIRRSRPPHCQGAGRPWCLRTRSGSS